MILQDKATIPYLKAFKAGKIKKGIGIGCVLDEYFVYKNGNFNMFLGLDNVGKTNFPPFNVIAVAFVKCNGEI